MPLSWERLTWAEWDTLLWSQWGQMRLYETIEALDRGPISPPCALTADVTTLQNHTGWFWNYASPVRDLYGALQSAVCSYVNHLLEELCIVTKAQTIRRSEFYYARRRMLLLLDAAETRWSVFQQYGIVDIESICNREHTDTPSAVILSPGQFVLDEDGNLSFTINIANDSRFIKFTDGGKTYIACWAISPVVLDYGLYRNFGAAFGIPAVPTRAVRNLIRYLYDAMLAGASMKHYFAIDAALRGLPLAENDGEIVTNIIADDSGTTIVTDKNRYVIWNYDPAVSVNDVLYAGQPLVLGHGYFDCHNGSVPANIDYVIVPVAALQHISALFVRTIQDGGYRQTEGGGIRLLESDKYYTVEQWETPPGYLKLINSNVTVTVDHGGKEVSWSVSEDPEVNAWFWRETRIRELKYNTKLYDLIVAKYGEIPGYINPLQFFAKYVFRGGVMIITLPPAMLAGQSYSISTLFSIYAPFILYGATKQPTSDSASESAST